MLTLCGNAGRQNLSFRTKCIAADEEDRCLRALDDTRCIRNIGARHRSPRQIRSGTGMLIH